MRRTLALSLVLGAVLASTAASAQKKGGTLLVLKLEAEALPADLATALDEAIREGVKKSKRAKLLAAPALDFGGMQMAAGCFDDGADCLAQMGRPLNAERVMRVVMTGTAKDATFTFTIVSVRKKGRPQTYEAKLSDLKPDSAEELSWHTETALGGKPAVLGGSIVLMMGSSIGSLEGAEYFLDDNKVPKSQLDAIVPGNHRLEVHQKGFETFIWIGEIKKGRAEQVKVELKPKGSLAYDPPPPSEGLVTPPVSPPPPEVETPEVSAEPPPPPITAVTTEKEGEGKIVYTFVIGGAAVIAAAVGVAFSVIGLKAQSALKERSNLENYHACTGATLVDDNGQPVNPQPASLDKDSTACAAFQPYTDRLETATIGHRAGYISAGVLAVGAIAVYFLERSSGESTETGVAFGVAPTDGGAEASMMMRF
jgi:hypothetical protein